MLLSDQQWLLLQPHFARSSSRGRPALDDRLILELVLLKISSGIPWYDLPMDSPAWQTCYPRYHRWHQTGVWNCLLKVLINDLRERGGFDLLKLWEDGQLKLIQDANDQIRLECPAEFEDTWQQSTALLLLLVVRSVINQRSS
jgi:transposase